MKTLSFQFNQQGSVLILTLLLLVMLTVVAVTQVNFNRTQTHIATNTADSQVAFQTAEGALNEATNNLIAGNFTTTSFLSNANGLYYFNQNNAPMWANVDWTSSNAIILSFKGQSSARGAYMIEQLPSVILPGQNANSPAQVFRITAHGAGASGSSPITLQSTLQLQQ
jgi:type IV pilus assembly protein PilX